MLRKERWKEKPKTLNIAAGVPINGEFTFSRNTTKIMFDLQIAYTGNGETVSDYLANIIRKIDIHNGDFNICQNMNGKDLLLHQWDLGRDVALGYVPPNVDQTEYVKRLVFGLPVKLSEQRKSTVKVKWRPVADVMGAANNTFTAILQCWPNMIDYDPTCKDGGKPNTDYLRYQCDNWGDYADGAAFTQDIQKYRDGEQIRALMAYGSTNGSYTTIPAFEEIYISDGDNAHIENMPNAVSRAIWEMNQRMHDQCEYTPEGTAPCAQFYKFTGFPANQTNDIFGTIAAAMDDMRTVWLYEMGGYSSPRGKANLPRNDE